ncbi:barstar family protein [Amycolatopsis sp. NPDC051758]|uniref:barstar family protein n=1 Tax=Amycolatopsis sp. NPDC051758 TaxID=3363935 RepID=UPI0037956C74
MRVVIDGKAIRSEADLHDQLAGPLDFGPYYGRNLNALWDRLYRDVERPVELVWADAAVSEEHLGAELFATIAKLMTDVMAGDAEHPAENRFTVRFA